jgi:hydroxylamine dehydrogenase
MAPDYAWWHGFYELKHRFNRIVKETERLERTGRAHQYMEFPGKFRR